MPAAQGIVLLLGAQTALGRACLSRLLALPVQVIAVGSPSAPYHAEVGAGCEWLAADRSSAEGQGRVTELLRQRGPWRALINVLPATAAVPFTACDAGEALTQLRAEIASSVLFMRTVLPFMRASEGGCILSLAPRSAQAPAVIDPLSLASYSFLAAFSQAVQDEVAGQGIRLMCCLPTAGECAEVSLAAQAAQALSRCGLD
jgi:short-subunit dehydrogenase